MNRYDSYKNVDLAWLKEVPSHWEVKRVKRLFYISKDISYIENPVVLSLARDRIKIRDISTNEGQLAESYSRYNKVKKGDLLLNPMDLYSGANCNISHVEGVISPAYINLRANTKLHSKYFDYLFKIQYTSFAFQSVGKGVSLENRWTLSSETLLNYILPIPPLSEQKQIADYLDWKINEIDKLIDIEREKVRELNKIRKGVLAQSIKEMKEYSVMPLKRILKVKNIKYSSIDYEIPLLSVVREEGIVIRNIGIDSTNHNVIPEDLSNYKIVEKGNFVMNKMKAWQGAYGISDYTGVVSPAYFVFELRSKDIDKQFFHKFIRCEEYINQFAKFSKGIRTDQWDFDITELSNILFRYPKLCRQREIVDEIESKETIISQRLNYIDNQINNLQSLKQSLISEVVTGKIDVRDIKIPYYEKIDISNEKQEHLEERQV